MATLASKPGLTNASTLSIPKQWDPTWFRGIISNLLQGADVRNAVGANGISVSGNIASPYATIGFKTPVTLSNSSSPATTDLILQGSDYQMLLYAPTGAANAKYYAIRNANGSFAITTVDDALSPQSNAFAITRTGTAVNDIEFAVDVAGTAMSLNNRAGGAAGTNFSWRSQGVEKGFFGNGTNVQGLSVDDFGVGTATGGLILSGSANGTAGIIFKVIGGASEAMRILNTGQVRINATNAVANGLVIYGVSAGGSALQINNSATTGTGTATFTATNKPTATAGGPVTWIPVSVDGSVRYIPAWA
jgi:hypothetical protein